MSRLSPLAPVTLGLLILVGCSSTPSIPPRGADVTDSHVASFRQKEDEQLLQKQVLPPLDAPLTLLEAPLPRYPSFLLNDTSPKARGDVTVSFEIMPSGLVGTEVIRQLEAEGHEALRLVRRKPTSPKEVEWNPAAGYIQEGIMETIDAVVNMAGATTGKIPWTAKYKEEIVSSRLDSTRTLVKAMAAR